MDVFEFFDPLVEGLGHFKFKYFNMIKVPRIVGVGTDITSVARMIDIIKRSQSIEERFL